MRELTLLEKRIVAIAREHDSLAELCSLVDYEPDIGKVPEYWRPRPWVHDLARALESHPRYGASRFIPPCDGT